MVICRVIRTGTYGFEEEWKTRIWFLEGTNEA